VAVHFASEKIGSAKTERTAVKKSSKKSRSNGAQSAQSHLSLVGFVRRNLQAFVIEQGMLALQEVLREEQEELCGPAHKKGASDEAKRWGTARGRLAFGGQRITVERPRVRKSGKEVSLPSWEEFSNEDPLDEATYKQMVLGVSTRNFARSLDELPSELESHGATRSAASRRFAKRTQEQFDEWLGRSLTDMSLVAIMIDGIVVDGQSVLVALGITEAGEKQPLGVHLGTTENTTVVQGLLDNLIERGLDAMAPRLFVIDGGKALRRAIKNTFGRRALVQRCQVHKMRNVLEHLPKSKQRSVGAQLKEAYRSRSKATARKRLQQLISHLADEHPDAAASLREGLEETLSLKDLGLSEALERTLSTTNVLENLNGSIRRVTRNVKHWKDGKMIQRWVVAGLLEAEGNFRKLRGFQDLTKLSLYLLTYAEQTTSIDDTEAAA
jgi:transposase-like protein